MKDKLKNYSNVGETREPDIVNYHCPLYQVGDKGWLVLGYRAHGLIAAECTVTEVINDLNKKFPEAQIFYYLDEPIGHSIAGDELMSREEAEEELLDRYHNELEFNGAKQTDITLEDFRREQKIILNDYNKYPEKKHLLEWFNVKDIT